MISAKKEILPMKKARLTPLYFDPGKNDDFEIQLRMIDQKLGDFVELLPPLPLGSDLPEEADAVIFPQLLGVAYRQLPYFKAIDRPILFLTSEFCTLMMWDWEISAYLASEGVKTIAPYTIEQAKMVCRAIACKRELKETKFLVYQDEPGDKGFQPEIFKRFYWWEDECTERIYDRFGVQVVKRSFRELGQRAKEISNEAALDVMVQKSFPTRGIKGQAILEAVKMYLALKSDIDHDPAIRSVGINCLNESHFSTTTPCLAWNWLYEEQGIIWGCEADTLSMLTEYILDRSLQVPFMMSNLYPFLLGQAALKHERIDHFPEVESNPEDHILVAHCGYFGFTPQKFCTDWCVTEKVLAIVDENAHVLDARMPTGKMTLAKMQPTVQDMTVAEGDLVKYAQFPGSDCRNGAVLKLQSGHRFVTEAPSCHHILTVGSNANDIEMIGKVFDFGIHRL